jgi:hypothetical protein
VLEVFGIQENRGDYQGLEGDRKFINEFIKGLDKDELREFKKKAMLLMEEQGVYEPALPVLYRNCYKYIVARRTYKYEIEAYTGIKILGDYISTKDWKWKWLPKVLK